VLSRTEAGLSGTTSLDPSEDLLLGELTLLPGSSVRTECKFCSCGIFNWMVCMVDGREHLDRKCRNITVDRSVSVSNCMRALVGIIEA
jgi:hypothetical protein